MLDGDIRLAKPSKDFLEGLLCIEMEEGKRKKRAENACLFSFFFVPECWGNEERMVS